MNAYEFVLAGLDISHLDAVEMTEAALLSFGNGAQSFKMTNCTINGVTGLKAPLLKMVGRLLSASGSQTEVGRHFTLTDSTLSNIVVGSAAAATEVPLIMGNSDQGSPLPLDSFVFKGMSVTNVSYSTLPAKHTPVVSSILDIGALNLTVHSCNFSNIILAARASVGSPFKLEGHAFSKEETQMTPSLTVEQNKFENLTQRIAGGGDTGAFAGLFTFYLGTEKYGVTIQDNEFSGIGLEELVPTSTGAARAVAVVLQTAQSKYHSGEPTAEVDISIVKCNFSKVLAPPALGNLDQELFRFEVPISTLTLDALSFSGFHKLWTN